MNYDKLIPAAPAALLFAGAFSAFSSSTTTLPSPAGAARALDPHQNRPIAQAGPRASEEDPETEVLPDDAVTETVCCPILLAVTSCCIEDTGGDEGPVYTAC